MSKLLKSFFAASALLTLAPTAAPALPPQCAEICDYSPCNQLCSQGTLVTRCSDWGICGGARHEDVGTTASVSEDVAQEAEASSLVCSAAQ